MAGYAQGNFTGIPTALAARCSAFIRMGNLCGYRQHLRRVQLDAESWIPGGAEYYLTGFGSKEQNNLGYNIGIVYRFGKQ